MIAFSGLDGAGKSTQINLLTKKYSSRGSKSHVFWSRGGYSPGMKWLKNILRISKQTSQKENSNRDEARAKSFSSTIVRKTWLILSIFDLIFFYAVYIRLMELFGTKIICDRYIYDTLLDFQINFPEEKVEEWFLWKSLIFFSVSPVKHFVITISVTESLYRSKQKNEPFPDSKEVLENRLIKYLKYVHSHKNIIHINGTDQIKNIHSEIVKELNL
jgi:dTMP kinase